MTGRFCRGNVGLVTPLLEGDLVGGGILGIVLGAILIVASAVFTGGAGAVLLFGMFSQTLFLMGAAMMLGGLANMLMQPDLPTLSTGGGLGGKSSATYSWSGISTQARPDNPIPVIYGKHIVGGNLINIFTERQGSDDYLFMLIALGEGEITGIGTEDNTDTVCTTTDRTSSSYKHPYILLDDQPFQNYTDVEWWYRNGTNLPNAAVESTDPSAQNIIPHFNGSRMQMDDGRPLTQDGVIYTTTKEVDMATIQIRFPSMFNANGGNVSATTVVYGIQFRKNGDSTWIDYTTTRMDPAVTPQTHASGLYTSPVRTWGDQLRYSTEVPGIKNGGAFALTDEKPDSIWMQVTASTDSDPGDPDHTDASSYDYWAPTSEYSTTYSLTFKNLTTNEIWTSNITYTTPVYWIYSNSGYGYNSGAWRKAGPSTIATHRITIGAYDVQVPGGLVVGETYIFSSNSSGQFWRTITDKSKTRIWDSTTLDFHTFTGGEGKQIYDIRVKRQNPISSDFNISNQSTLNSVIEIVNGDFIYPNTALLGFKIKATDQLSGSPPNINVLVKGLKILVPDHSGSESFEEIFWDDDASRWEYNGTERTWDNTTYVEEYSNNSMLCLKDLMTNKIYGLGEYTNDNDFNDANTISIVKECHIEYNPTEEDYVKWWTAGNDAEFLKSIEDGMANN